MNDLSAPFSERSVGCLCHPTSLPGRGAQGNLGPGARRFVDWLARAGIGWWQVLPLHPPDPFGSPYPARSAFAGSPELISLEDLASDGLLRSANLPRRAATRRSDRSALRAHEAGLRQAFFSYRGQHELRAPFEAEAEALDGWGDDWALFAALAGESGRAWPEWVPSLRRRESGALERARKRLAEELEFQRFVQLAFQRQWRKLREHAAAAGVRIFGDLPMFVAHDCADTWVHPELCGLDRRGRLRFTAGTPPDSFSADGQNWGVPAWDWKACEAEGWTFWRARIARELELVDALRLDHFLGYVRTYLHPTGHGRKARAHYADGPGKALFDALNTEDEALPFAAEDLGDVTPEARTLLAELGYPGMRILQYGFGGSTRENPHRLHEWPRDTIGYTGTHDNDTWVGWYRKLPAGRRTSSPEEATRRAVRVALGAQHAEVHLGAVRAVAASAAKTVVFPIQDLLGLPTGARMNRPGTIRGNWSFRLLPRECSPERANALLELFRLTGRSSR